jgi:hypothetical protein
MEDKILEALLSRGMISSESSRRYLQTGNNCFEVALFVAKQLGYRFPETRKEFTELYFREKDKLFWKDETQTGSSDCYLLIYEPDNVGPVHVAVQYMGVLYNFGADERDGFEVEARVPLTLAEFT